MPARKKAPRKATARKSRAPRSPSTPVLTKALREVMDAIVQLAHALADEQAKGHLVEELGRTLREWGSSATTTKKKAAKPRRR